MGGRLVETPHGRPLAPPSRGATNAWALAQATRDPYVILISIYIFAPYFVTRVVGDPVAGQAMIASAHKWGGWFVMLTAPLLGAMVDRLGPRKPGLALVVAAMTGLLCALWFSPPLGAIGGGYALPFPVMMVIFGALTVMISYHEMLHNALLIPAAGMAGTPRASGLALAGGNFMSVLMLISVLFAFALPGKVHWAWLPSAPLFGLDRALGEPERLTAVIVGVTLALGALPLFLFVPDMRRSGLSIAAAFRAGAGDLAALVRGARGHRDPLIFLGARMIYTDGLTGILIFGGLYAAGAMHWATLQMIGYGIVLSIAAVIGGLLAGWLDMRIGPKLAVKLELALLIVMQTLTLGMARDRILFQPYVGPPLWKGAMFTTLPEIVFLGIGCIIAITVTAAYASSRTLLTRVAPEGKTGIFFGLYVLSGTATMWLGPLLVQIATSRWHTQAAGMAPIVGMLAVGLGALFLVRGGGRVAS